MTYADAITFTDLLAFPFITILAFIARRNAA